MTEPCVFCQGPCNPHDLHVAEEHRIFIFGQRKNHSALRQPLGIYAHEACIEKQKAGQAPDQETLDL